MRPVLAVVFGIVLFCCSSLPALADPVADIARFFRAATGVVIMPAGDEYLIDLDASKGIQVGDLLTVVHPGEKIIHPVSGELLGNLDTLKGVFQVTRIKTGYAYMRPVGKVKELNRGDAVRLWDQVPAAFRTERGGDEAFARQLQVGLAQLDWRSAGENAVITFVALPDRLEVRAPGGEVLTTASLGTPPPASSAGGAKTAAGGLAGSVAGAITPAAIIKNDSTASAGVWMSNEFPGEIAGVHVADLDGDGRQEVALAFPHRLEVGRILDRQYSRLALLDLGYGQKVVALDGADLDGNGRTELYLTAARDGQLQSMVVDVDGAELKKVSGTLPWYFRTMELPGEGKVLLGQRMGRLDEDFAGPVVRLVRKGATLMEGTPLPVPPGVTLFGFHSVPEEKGLFVHLNTFDELKVVNSTGETLWQSEEKAGGSEAFIERQDPSKNPADGPASRNVFLPARLLPGPDRSLLVPVNEGSRFFSRVRTFDKSSLRALVWNGFTLQELWRTQPQGGYLADFSLADADNDGMLEIVQALVFSRDGMMSKGRSALGLFELQP